MKRIIALLLVLIMTASFAACGSKKKENEVIGANIVNPMHEATEEEIASVIGEIMLPAGAEDVKYHTIDIEHKIYQIKFTLEDIEYCYRVSDDPELTDTSGMYYDWSNTEVSSVEGRDATVSWNENETGIIYWYDVVPGLNYSLSMSNGASFDALVLMANNIFIPVQGEVG